MPWKSRWSISIPTLSIPDYVFISQSAPLSAKPILLDAENPTYHLTHRTYRSWSQRFAAGLQNAGFRQGDRLLLYSGNTLFFPVVLMGTIMAGGIFTGANPSYVPRELAYQIQDSGAVFLIVAESGLDTALEAAASIQFPRKRIFTFDDGYATFDNQGQSTRGISHWSELVAPPTEASAAFQWETFTTRSQMDRTAVLNYSSGTTGVPKGVEITHMNYISNCMQTEFMQSLHPDYEAQTQRAVGLGFLPMYHAYGQTHLCVSGVLKGIPVYLMRKFDFLMMLRYIEKYRVTNLALVPPIVVALTKRPEVRDYDISCVMTAGCGAAPLGRESAVEFNNLVAKGRFRLRQGWGMTEITCSAVGWDPRIEPTSGAIGELNPNIEGMIVDDEGREVEDGQRGEFWVRGPNVMKGYWRNEEATRQTKTSDGWLKTGDIAYRDKDGLLHIVDRKKELIKVKGNQVAPAELEALLLDHPAIQDAAVVGVAIGGEEYPRAYVVLQDSHVVSAEDIATWLSQRVAPHKRLTGGVVVTDVIPKNPSGKILRKVLRDRAKRKVGDREPRRESRL